MTLKSRNPFQHAIPDDPGQWARNWHWAELGCTEPPQKRPDFHKIWRRPNRPRNRFRS